MTREEYKKSLRIRRHAQAFVIWREGRSVKWDCTVSDLAEATKINRNTVAKIVAERGWPVQPEPTGRARRFSPMYDHVATDPASESEAPGMNLFAALLAIPDNTPDEEIDDAEADFAFAH